ncbi:MAG: UPF0182 family protein [Mogibacterium sp.]|nr:UPF0182 family protein [Mogibacterium sp.]
MVLFGMVGFITDWMWFKDLGYGRVFWTKIITQLEIGIPVFIIATLLVRLYLNSLRKGYFKTIESHEIPDVRRLNRISWGLAAVFGLGSAIFASSDTWMNFLQFMHSTEFGLADPLFNLDISFYIFKLAFLMQLNNLVLGLIIGIVVITVIFYGILLTVRTPDFFDREEEGEEEQGEEQTEAPGNDIPFNTRNIFGRGMGGRQRGRRRNLDINDSNFAQLMQIASGKLTILGILFYLMVAVDFFLKQFDLLHAHTGVVYGAGFTDVNVVLWVYRIIIVLSLIGAVTLAVHLRKKEFKKLLRIPAALILIGVIGSVAGMAVQSLIVSPDEINKESKYLENNIEYTRHAYGLDNIQVSEFPADNSLTGQDILDNEQTISNIRINDYEPVKDFYNQTQSIRQYYDFHDVDIDRYIINGDETQTYLSPREINEEKISTTWINKHLKYTHGYGVTLSRVDAVTSSGQPDVVIKNIPPESSVPEVQIDRPEIYFGELTNDYIIVNTDEMEFDYPDGNENKYNKYEGTGGIKLNLINRILFSIREGSLKLLVSSNVNSDSRIIIYRNIVDRVHKIMPYLSYESDPYMTVADGKLYWIFDAYTASSYYPYSEPYSGEMNTTNYVRNSVKVVVDAYNGDVSYYVIDDADPIAQTFMKIYPTLFKEYDQMPESIKAHIRYPNTLFKIQASVYTKYHMDDVKVFYQNEDLWDTAHQIYGTEDTEMSPSYFIFELPNEEKAEFINMIPFTPRSKQNMTAIMLARNDGDHYGQMLVYKFPKNKTIYGPMQIEAQIDQSTEISKEFSLWNSAGSTYRRGDMFVIPINQSLLYVEPVYLEASNQAIPEVKRVIVAYGDRIAYEPTLSAALEDLFGEGYESETEKKEKENADAGDQESGGAVSTAELIRKANEAYDNAVEAQRNGDWKKYGEYLAELEGYLNELESR